MCRWQRRLGSALLGLSAMLPALAQTGPAASEGTMRWLVQQIPPHFTYRGGQTPLRVQDLGNGEIDGLLRLLIGRLPQWQHEFVEASFPRFESMVRQGETLCSVLHVRTPERLGWMYFISLYPTPLARQIHVVVRRDQLERFQQRGRALSLAELLNRPDLRLLLPRDRSFGPRIDTLLQATPAHPGRGVVAGRHMQVLAMLSARRMDYTLEYPAVVDEYLRSTGNADELATLPLGEGSSTSHATASCSRSPEGRRRIEAIDQALRALATDPQRERWLREWRGDRLDEAERQRLLRYLDARGRDGAQIE